MNSDLAQSSAAIQTFAQRKSANQSEHLEVPTIVHEVLNSPGRPLDEGTRSFFEPRFNHDFSGVRTTSSSPSGSISPKLTVGETNDASEREADQLAHLVLGTPAERQHKPPSTDLFEGVRIHNDPHAAESAQALNARAYTLGNHIVFGHRQYEPQSAKGQYLIAHELSHTIQHSAAPDPANAIRRVTQEPTLDEAKKTGKSLPVQKLKTMDVRTLAAMSGPDRRAWYVDKLGAFGNQLKESAAKHTIPVQLLATVILNELADINWVDTTQADLFVTKGSLGVAQIQIDTAIKDNLLPGITEAEGKEAYDEMVRSLPPTSSRLAARIMQNKDSETRLAVNRRLQIPQYGIDAAAREIRLLLDKMMGNRGAAWQTQFGFTHAGLAPAASAQLIYNDVSGADQRTKELNLANMITGAYNSPNVISAADTSKFPNANIHGQNSRMIAGDLFDFGLYRP